MYHSHACGWVREEPYLFADSICKETKRAPYFVAQSEGFTLENPDDVPITECRVYYLTEPFCYTHDTEKDAYALEAEWQVLLYEGTIPPAAKAYYLEAISEIDGKEFVTTSPFVMLEEEKN